MCTYVGYSAGNDNAGRINDKPTTHKNEGKEMRYRRVRLGDCLPEEDCLLEGVALSSVFSGRKGRANERTSAVMTVLCGGGLLWTAAVHES